MSKNVKINNVTYSDVPSIDIPLATGSGNASFFDVSGTTRTASDVASGKYFFTSRGVLTQGTSSGGGTAVFYDTSDGDAETGHILTGKKGYNSSGAVSGSMANNGSTSGTISTKAGTVSVPAGYTSGGTVSISTTEQNKIISSNIKSGVTILGVSGATNVVDTTIASGGARQRNILNGYKAYVNGSLVEGNATTPTVTQNTTTKVLTIS